MGVGAAARLAGAMGRLAQSRAARRIGAFEEAAGEQSQSLNSSAIIRAGYSADDQTMSLTFIRGRTYTYYGVPASVYTSLVNSPSPGRYFNFNVRDRYPFS